MAGPGLNPGILLVSNGTALVALSLGFLVAGGFTDWVGGGLTTGAVVVLVVVLVLVLAGVTTVLVPLLASIRSNAVSMVSPLMITLFACAFDK